MYYKKCLIFCSGLEKSLYMLDAVIAEKNNS